MYVLAQGTCGTHSAARVASVLPPTEYNASAHRTCAPLPRLLNPHDLDHPKSSGDASGLESPRTIRRCLLNNLSKVSIVKSAV